MNTRILLSYATPKITMYMTSIYNNAIDSQGESINSAQANEHEEDDVSILSSNMAHKSFIDIWSRGLKWIHKETTSHITFKSSFLKYFNEGSTTEPISSCFSI